MGQLCSNSLLSEQLCLILRGNGKVKVGDENLTFVKTINSQYNSLTSLLIILLLQRICIRISIYHYISIFMFVSSLKILKFIHSFYT
jgi:hypothetical protein